MNEITEAEAGLWAKITSVMTCVGWLQQMRLKTFRCSWTKFWTKHSVFFRWTWSPASSKFREMPWRGWPSSLAACSTLLPPTAGTTARKPGAPGKAENTNYICCHPFCISVHMEKSLQDMSHVWNVSLIWKKTILLNGWGRQQKHTRKHAKAFPKSPKLYIWLPYFFALLDTLKSLIKKTKKTMHLITRSALHMNWFWLW